MNTDTFLFKGRYRTRVEVAVAILTSPEWRKIKAPLELLRDYRRNDTLRIRKGPTEVSLVGFDDPERAWENIQALIDLHAKKRQRPKGSDEKRRAEVTKNVTRQTPTDENSGA